jgi:enoyl-CoA hydratase/carnithine racemase
MYGALADAIERVESEPALRALLLTGSGEYFSSGNDIGDFLRVGELTPEVPVVRFLQRLVATDIPIVAAVNGPAVGVGVTLLFHCDFVYAGPEAVFTTPFVDLGLVPEAASSLSMPQQLGYRCAAEMLLLGEPMTAADLQARGLVTATVSGSELLPRAREVADRLARKPARALRAGKRLLRLPPEAWAQRVERELKIFAQALGSAEAREAMTAFMEKRPPDFSRCE